MKKLFISILLLISLFIFVPKIYSNNNINNKSFFKQAKLIENHIINYKNKIKDLQNKYQIEDSNILKENYNELEKLVWALRKIQTQKVDYDIANKVIQEVIRKLKIINDNLKLYIKLKKNDYEKKFNKYLLWYSKIAHKLSSNIKTLINKMVLILKEKKKLTKKHKIVIEHLINLEKESKNLDNFDKYEYNSIEEIKFNLSQSIKNIRKELKEIKNTLKK